MLFTESVVVTIQGRLCSIIVCFTFCKRMRTLKPGVQGLCNLLGNYLQNQIRGGESCLSFSVLPLTFNLAHCLIAHFLNLLNSRRSFDYNSGSPSNPMLIHRMFSTCCRYNHISMKKVFPREVFFFYCRVQTSQ